MSYHYENNKGDGWSWGTQPNWDTTMTYGVGSKNNTLSAQWQWLPSSTTIFTAKYLGFWTNDQPFVPGRRAEPSRLHQLVEVGAQLRHRQGLPLRRGPEIQPPDHPGRRRDLRRGLPRRARHQVRRPVHQGPRQLDGRLLPELRQLHLSAGRLVGLLFGPRLRHLGPTRPRPGTATARASASTTVCSSTTTRPSTIRS
ncbi:MAG: hypothetical protein M0C28_47995 [Candidatus Moduliflexus flocculans]|nr:hypothetical protein [Candidatus Moduliflexus flocculans]